MAQSKIPALPDTVRAAITEASRAPRLEAVPASMMALFTDKQWPELVFQLQPSLRLVESVPAADSDQPVRWIVFKTSDDVLVRTATGQDYPALSLFLAGNNFDRVAAILWPDQDRETRHGTLTDALLRWLQEGLIIDAGVPLPDGATFESEPDDATRSVASSPAPEKGSR